MDFWLLGWKSINKAGNFPPLDVLGSGHPSPLGSFPAGEADLEQLVALSLGRSVCTTCFTCSITSTQKNPLLPRLYSIICTFHNCAACRLSWDKTNCTGCTAHLPTRLTGKIPISVSRDGWFYKTNQQPKILLHKSFHTKTWNVLTYVLCVKCDRAVVSRNWIQK